MTRPLELSQVTDSASRYNDETNPLELSQVTDSASRYNDETNALELSQVTDSASKQAYNNEAIALKLSQITDSANRYNDETNALELSQITDSASKQAYNNEANALELSQITVRASKQAYNNEANALELSQIRSRDSTEVYLRIRVYPDLAEKIVSCTKLNNRKPLIIIFSWHLTCPFIKTGDFPSSTDVTEPTKTHSGYCWRQAYAIRVESVSCLFVMEQLTNIDIRRTFLGSAGQCRRICSVTTHFLTYEVQRNSSYGDCRFKGNVPPTPPPPPPQPPSKPTATINIQNKNRVLSDGRRRSK